LSCAAATILAGCGASQAPIGAPGAMSKTSASAAHADRGKSWMLPEAKSEALLYVSDVYGVHIFSYPKGQHVGDIYGFSSPAGLCSDQNGDVFVTDTPAYQVYEYAHGDTKRVNTFYDNYLDFNPINCSVDPTTENLAVANLDSGYVVVFPQAKEAPKAYYDAHTSMAFCFYDDKGNLFVDHVYSGRKNYIGELPKGAKQFKNYLLDQRIRHPGGIQFDGRYVVIESQDNHAVHRLRLSGARAFIVSSTSLKGTTWAQQYWIQKNTLIGPDDNSTIDFWGYPKGGSPTGSITGFTLPYGATVSPHR
jgi:NHL repeat